MGGIYLKYRLFFYNGHWYKFTRLLLQIENTLILRIMAAVTVRGLIFFCPAAFLFEVRPLVFGKLFPIFIPRIKSAQWQKSRKLQVNIVIYLRK